MIYDKSHNTLFILGILLLQCRKTARYSRPIRPVGRHCLQSDPAWGRFAGRFAVKIWKNAA